VSRSRVRRNFERSGSEQEEKEETFVGVKEAKEGAHDTSSSLKRTGKGVRKRDVG